MTNERTEAALKLFAISNQLLEHDLDKIEEEFAIDLARSHSSSVTSDDTYYPQIDRAIRQEAAAMSQHYEVFYSLEKTIRSLVSDTIQVVDGGDWWTKGRVPQKVKTDADSRLQKEVELGEIIKSNWDLFGSIFSSPKAVERVMANLNTLRGPIAHCSPLAEDEVVRLRLSVRDWFRLME
jgi:hypothetical protein